MIIVKITGGLGNQMFQYALGFSLAKKNNSICKLDISVFSKYKLHKFCLNIFNIHAEVATEQEIKKFKTSPFSTLINNLFSKVGFSKPILNPKYVNERGFNFDLDILKLRGDYYLDGYWQSEKYFIDYQDSIKNEFRVKEPPNPQNAEFLNKIKNCESVAIHVRHGDYLTNQKTKAVHGVLPLDYYNRAIKIMIRRSHNPTFFVFSDNIEWAKQNFSKDIPIYFLGHNSAEKNYEDLRLMSACKHSIIANSSFSWWGAWLNNNTHKIVIAPKKWFNIEDKNTRDLIPQNWLKI